MWHLYRVELDPERWSTINGNPGDELRMLEPGLRRLGGRLRAAWPDPRRDRTVFVSLQGPRSLSSASSSVANAFGGKPLRVTERPTAPAGVRVGRRGFALSSMNASAPMMAEPIGPGRRCDRCHRIIGRCGDHDPRCAFHAFC